LALGFPHLSIVRPQHQAEAIYASLYRESFLFPFCREKNINIEKKEEEEEEEKKGEKPISVKCKFDLIRFE
jgi:hypothetical protein